MLTHETTAVVEVGMKGVQVHRQNFWFVGNPGKIPENQGKISESPGKDGAQRCLTSKNDALMFGVTSK